MRTALPILLLVVTACGSGGGKKANDTNVVAVGKASGLAPGASAPPPCDVRGAPIDAEHAEGMRIVERCVTGASSTTKAALEKVLALGADKPLAAEMLRRDLEAAWATGLVDQIEATARQSGSGCVLFLAVTERPKISAIAFEGLVAMKDDPSITSFPKIGAPLSVQGIATASEKLIAAYGMNGYDEVKVDHVVEPDGDGKARVKIVVVEGTRAKVGKITFAGVGGGRDAALRKAMELAEGAPLDPDRFTRAVLLVASFYFDRGFINVKVEEPKRTRAADGTTTIALKITEGPVFRIGKLSVSKVDAATQKEVLAGLKVKSGEVFNRSKLKADLEDLESRSRQKGKPLSAEPETKIDPKAGLIDITLAVKER